MLAPLTSEAAGLALAWQAAGLGPSFRPPAPKVPLPPTPAPECAAQPRVQALLLTEPRIPRSPASTKS